MLAALWGLISHDDGLDADAPICGACGYCVRGATGFKCTECGADLRESGVLPADSRGSVSRTGWFAGLAVVFVAVALLVSHVLLKTVLPFTESQEISREFTCQAPLNETISAMSNGHRFWQPAIMRHPQMTPEIFLLTTRKAPFGPEEGLLEVNIKAGDFRYMSNKTPSGQWVTGTGFTGAVLAQWLTQGPLGKINNSSPDPRVRNVADAVYGALKELQRGKIIGAAAPILDSSGVQIGIAKRSILWAGHDDPPGWMFAILAGFWLLGGLVIIRQLSRRSRRRAILLAEFHKAWLLPKADVSGNIGLP